MTVTDKQIEQAFEQAYAAVVTTSPLPLDWDEASERPVQLSPPPRVRLMQRPLAVFVTVAAVILAGVAAVALTQPNSTVLEAGASDQWRTVVFLAEDASQDQIDSITATLQDVDGVTRSVYVDKSMALDEALVMFANDERLIAIIRDDPSTLPASLRFATIDEASARTLEQKATELANSGETAIANTTVNAGKLVETEPLDLTEQDFPPSDS